MQDQGYGAGVAYGRGLLDALSLGDPPVELREREVRAPALALQRRREVLGELGGEVVRLVAREPLLEGLEGRPDGAFGPIPALQLTDLRYPLDELVALHSSFLTFLALVTRAPCPTNA